MPRINEERRKEIETKVDEYIEKKKELLHTPEALMDFYVSGIFVGMNKYERFHAKTYFKSKLPYTEWREMVSKDPESLIDDIEHYRELQNKGRM